MIMLDFFTLRFVFFRFS